jgi:hypothetical protein
LWTIIYFILHFGVTGVVESKTALGCSALWTTLTLRVKSERGRHHRELRQRVQLERRLIARLRTANIRFTDAQIERIWAIARDQGEKTFSPSSPKAVSPSSFPIKAKPIGSPLAHVRREKRGSSAAKLHNRYARAESKAITVTRRRACDYF